MAKSGDDKKPTCFMAMPITTHSDHIERYGGDDAHWVHVMSSLFEKAIVQAGFEPIRPAAQGSHLIHGLIIRHLSTADLVLVDLSTHNPNVFFELGVRTSLNLPIALVRDEHTSLPFDTSGINTYEYDSSLRGWEIEAQQQRLAKHITDSHQSCAGQNPLWRQFGLTIKASEPDTNESPLEAKVDLLSGQVASMKQRFEEDRLTDRVRLVGARRAREEALRSAKRDLNITDSTPEGLCPADLFARDLYDFMVARYPRWAAQVNIVKSSPNSALVILEGVANDVLKRRVGDIARKYGVDITIVVEPMILHGDRALDPDAEAPRSSVADRHLDISDVTDSSL